MVHQSSEMVAGSVLVVGGQQGWRILQPQRPHLVPLCPDDLELLSAATKTHRQPSMSVISCFAFKIGMQIKRNTKKKKKKTVSTFLQS